jgi:heme/copper-type cytochrome/quinol oxidase subunit 2
LAELTGPQVCPNKEEEIRSIMVYYLAMGIIANLLLSALVGYCCFNYRKK